MEVQLIQSSGEEAVVCGASSEDLIMVTLPSSKTIYFFLAVSILAVVRDAAAGFADGGSNEELTEVALAIEETDDGDFTVSPIRRAVAFSASALLPTVAEERAGLTTTYRWRPTVSHPRHLPSVSKYHGEYDHRSHPIHHPVVAHPVTVQPNPVHPLPVHHPSLDPHGPIVTPIEYTPTAYPAFPPASSPPAADFPAYTPHHGDGDVVHGGKEDADGEAGGGDSGARPQQPRDYFPPPSVLGVLEDEEATTFLSLLERAGLLETLGGEKRSEESPDDPSTEDPSSEGPWTVFAPTNDAFANMDPDTIDALSNNDDLLQRVLKYHIVPEGKIFTRIVKDNLLAPSLEGTDLRFNKNDGAGVITINGAELVPDKSDQRAANGVVHFLNDVIYPLPVGSLYDTLDDDSR